MRNDLISRDDAVKALKEYAEQKHVHGEVELANGILKAVCYLEKKENIPTAFDLERVKEKFKGFADMAAKKIWNGNHFSYLQEHRCWSKALSVIEEEESICKGE